MVSTNNLTWTYCFLHLMADVDRPTMYLQNSHNHVCTRLYSTLTQTTLLVYLHIYIFSQFHCNLGLVSVGFMMPTTSPDLSVLVFSFVWQAVNE